MAKILTKKEIYLIKVLTKDKKSAIKVAYSHKGGDRFDSKDQGF